MSRFAEKTTVSPEKSKMEIETTLKRYGASHFGYMTDPGKAIIMFEAHGKRVKFFLPLPDPNSEDITHDRKGYMRSDSAKESALQQALRQKWRALALAIKAKLETVESGIASFEDEFLSYIVMPSGRTIGEWAIPQLDNMVKLPPMLPGVRTEESTIE